MKINELVACMQVKWVILITVIILSVVKSSGCWSLRIKQLASYIKGKGDKKQSTYLNKIFLKWRKLFCSGKKKLYVIPAQLTKFFKKKIIYIGSGTWQMIRILTLTTRKRKQFMYVIYCWERYWN